MGWNGKMVQCNLCFYIWEAVFEDGTDIAKLQCPKCKCCNSKLIGTAYGNIFGGK